jgi:hypothetical protein
MEKKTFKGSLLFIYWIGEKSDGIFWIRLYFWCFYSNTKKDYILFKFGFLIKDVIKHPLIFSERKHWWGFLFTYLGTSYYFRFLKNISCDKYVNF